MKSKGGCDRLSDLVDLGDGYDETDQFIDNSEAVSSYGCITSNKIPLMIIVAYIFFFK